MQIEIKNVIKIYQNDENSCIALKDINLSIKSGDFVSIVGKSGSGKSSLLNIITGIDTPTEGEIWIGNEGIHLMKTRKISRWRGENIGVVFQFFQLLPALTVLENIMLPMEFCRKYHPKERRNKSQELLNLVGLAGFEDKLPNQLSGGQQQRVAIARALANDPVVIVADEPTGSLDSKTAEVIFALFEDLAAKGKTVIMVTHDEELANRANRKITIVDGEITQVVDLSGGLMNEITVYENIT
ncbi:ABC transporter ATP-binding protein [Bacillus sp. 31A1R]|uniref:ABC transporter ATP-binding protein n=1 Tax=Robertmurraya mangrovi TaxID=3098077 RepID=A0ABU5J0J5_9BACI|nr:ABC transporter ATP-binding protein [Bacillus sp. 31A1R]MDZ5472933.1 ABC transporter ATP-binding protein [Bacillus sp. 31A1R]